MGVFKKAMDRALARADGWVNTLTGIGNSMRDKRMQTSMYADVLTRDQAEEIWRGDDMGARIVETIPNEMLREGFTVKIQAEDGIDADATHAASEAVVARCEELDVEAKFKTALMYERAYGGAAILLGANDGQTDLRRPLNEDGIKSFDWLTVLEASELYPVQWYENPQAAKYGEPMIYELRPYSMGVTYGNIQVHETRLIKFGGIVVSKRQARNNNGWGDSVFVRVNRVLSDFHQSWASAAILLQDFSQAVLKIENLAELIASNQDDVVVRRAQAIDMGRSVARMVLLDATEDFERKATPMTGMHEMLEKFSVRLSAAADMPVTLLMGQSPAGLQATGASDIRFFYDRTRAKQRTDLKPKLGRCVCLIMRAQNGPTRGVEPDNWSIQFNPLWQASELEQADVRLKNAQADDIHLRHQVLMPEEVAVSRFGGDAYSNDITIDLEARAAMRSLKPVPEEKPPAEEKRTYAE